MSDPAKYLQVGRYISIPISEIEFNAIRASGAGGQNVNKVSSAIHLRFDVKRSSLNEGAKQRIMAYSDQRISSDGVIVIKSQTARNQARNKEIALERLEKFLKKIFTRPKTRIPTRRTKGANERRLKKKAGRSQIKAGRARIKGFD